MAGSGFDIGGATVTLTAGDVEIGAVELKNADSDARAKVAATGSVAEGDNAVAVQAPVLGATTGSALDADGAGTLQQYLRGLLKAFLARIFGGTYPGDSAPTVVSISGASAASGQIAAGKYLMVSDVDCAFITDSSAPTAVWGTNNYLPSNTYMPWTVTTGSNDYVAAETSGATGSLYIISID